jgi:aldehyde:ferredoxin oxidoreductase
VKAMALGYHKQILVVDLSSESWYIEEFDDEVYRQFYGGYGLGVYYIYNHLEPGTDPLGLGNILGFCPGLFTGTTTPFSGRYMVCGKSPLTGKDNISAGSTSNGGWGNANSGGFFGQEIKKVGFDGIFFKGKAKQPVYLFIDGNEIQLLDAKELWGKDVVQTEQIVENVHGERVRVACIGPAGENLCLISGIVNDSGRIAARSGLGAVMGSKNLKAVCLRGNKESGKIDFHDKSKLMEYIKQYNSNFREKAKKGLKTKFFANMWRFAPIIRMSNMNTTEYDNPSMAQMIIQQYSAAQLGTTAFTVISSQIGDSPVKNFKGVGYKDFPMKSAKKIGGHKIKEIMKNQYGCFSCPAQCGAILEYDGLPYPKKETHRPEYETCASFGSLILNDNLDLLLKVNEYLNRVGMDSISAGVVIAFIYECCERELLVEKDFTCNAYPVGFLPKWGDNSYLLQLLEMMVNREGIGDILADGVRIASEKIPGSKDFAMHANGQEIPMHDARMDPMLGVTYISDPTPGRHTAGSLNTDRIGAKYFLDKLGKFEINDEIDLGILQAKIVKFKQTLEATGLCLFANLMGPYPFLEIMQAMTGWDVSVEELLETGHRIQTLRQMFNVREGAINHNIPQRIIGSPPQTKGPLKGKSWSLEPIAQNYYEAMGYEKNGIPKKETLEKLKLEFAMSDLTNGKGVPEPLINEYLEPHNKQISNSKKITPLSGG